MKICPSMDMKVSPSNGRIRPIRYQRSSGLTERRSRLRFMLVSYIFLCSRPLNSIGLPFYNSPLLSSWTPQLESVKVSTAPMKIPQSVLSAIKMNDGIAYAPLPRELKGRRNMITVATPKDQGRFRSGKPRSDVSDVATRVPL